MNPALVCRTDSDESKKQPPERAGRWGLVLAAGNLSDAVLFGCGRMDVVRERRQNAGVVSWDGMIADAGDEVVAAGPAALDGDDAVNKNEEH